jgi:hypothetical protein
VFGRTHFFAVERTVYFSGVARGNISETTAITSVDVWQCVSLVAPLTVDVSAGRFVFAVKTQQRAELKSKSGRLVSVGAADKAQTLWEWRNLSQGVYHANRSGPCQPKNHYRQPRKNAEKPRYDAS